MLKFLFLEYNIFAYFPIPMIYMIYSIMRTSIFDPNRYWSKKKIMVLLLIFKKKTIILSLILFVETFPVSMYITSRFLYDFISFSIYFVIKLFISLFSCFFINFLWFSFSIFLYLSLYSLSLCISVSGSILFSYLFTPILSFFNSHIFFINLDICIDKYQIEHNLSKWNLIWYWFVLVLKRNA